MRNLSYMNAEFGLLNKIKNSNTIRSSLEGIGSGMVFGGAYGGMDYMLSNPQTEEEKLEKQKGVMNEVAKTAVATGITGGALALGGSLLNKRRKG